jgi:hypothetical protein
MGKKHIIGVFDDEDQVVGAIKKLKERKININDVYGPFASHEIISAVTRPSRLPYLSFLFGAGTVVGTFAFLYYTAVIDYPLSYGGKPIFAFPPMVVVIYLATILLTGTLSVFTFLGLSGLYPGKKAVLPGEGVTDDKFYLVTEDFDDTETTATLILKESGALEIRQES